MTAEGRRYAIYFTPPQGSPLERFGASVLGYDAYAGESVVPPRFDDVATGGLAVAIAAPRRYGFHATLKAPFRLASGVRTEDLAEAIRALARTREAVPVGCLVTALLGDFVALVPLASPAAPSILAAECVATFHPFAAPLDTGERARRRGPGLTPREEALLDRWGYPFVFEAFRFHMTLTGPLPRTARDQWLRRLAAAFAPCAEQIVEIDALTLMAQDPGAPFRVVERFPLVRASAG